MQDLPPFTELNVHYLAHKSPPVYPILRKIQSVVLLLWSICLYNKQVLAGDYSSMAYYEHALQNWRFTTLNRIIFFN